jgi:cytochrome c-type biogenesis protein CcmF
VLFHPPILYLGYVGFTVPFAFAIAALITGRVGEGWLMETRRWALFSWGFLTIGIILGGWWSYEVLGWSGVWAWDPVENASLLPWLTGHRLHPLGARAGAARDAARLEPEPARGHLRAHDPRHVPHPVGHHQQRPRVRRPAIVDGYLLGFFGVVVVVSLALIAWRGDRLRSPGVIDSPISREGAFLANNVLFACSRSSCCSARSSRCSSRSCRTADRRRGAVLRPAVDAARPDDAVPHGRGPGAAVAQGRPPSCCATGCSGRRGRCRLLGRSRSSSAPRAGRRCWRSGWVASPAGAALRQLVLATRRKGWRGLVGRANGGMIVHLGVIMIAVALAASNATPTRPRSRSWSACPAVGGHTFELLEITQTIDSRADVVSAQVLLDDTRAGLRPGGHQVPAPGHGHRHPERADRVHQGPLPDDRPPASPGRAR